jgi:hypothetical protein
MMHLNYSRMLLAIMVAAIVTVASPAGAQLLGKYRFRLEPFCNVVTLSVEQQGDIYVLTGFDDRCGASVRAAVTGTAYFNPNGTSGIGLTTIRPDGISTQDTVTINSTTLSGTWTDTASGIGGAFTYNPSSVSGTPRPVINAATKIIVSRLDYTVPGGGGYAGGRAVQCPTGYHATGGGATGGAGLGVSILLSAPNSTVRGLGNNLLDGDVPDAWYVYVRNDNAGTLDVHAYAVCVAP